MTPETRLLTADLHWEAAGKLAVGDELLALEEEHPRRAHRQWQRSVIKEAVEAVRPCFRLTLEDGASMACPADHEWLVDHRLGRRWMQVSEMKPGDRIVRVIDTWEPALSREAGYLAAAFDGEGSLRQNRYKAGCGATATALDLSFTQKDNAMLEETRRCLDALGFRYVERNHDGRHSDRGLRRLVIRGRGNVLRFLGEIRPVRLLALFDLDVLGAVHMPDVIRVVAKEDAGEQPVIDMRTSTRTCVADGFASHSGRPAVAG